VKDQRLATADETTPDGGIASPLHPVVLTGEKDEFLECAVFARSRDWFGSGFGRFVCR
jgi:hypothetical protein